MERIAHEAGIAKGTIYLYFRNKEELPRTSPTTASRSDGTRAGALRARAARRGKLAASHARRSSSRPRTRRSSALQEHRQLAPENPPLLTAARHNLEQLVSFIAGVIERSAAASCALQLAARRALPGQSSAVRF
jgi:AcrR family transcriptional regulator